MSPEGHGRFGGWRWVLVGAIVSMVLVAAAYNLLKPEAPHPVREAVSGAVDGIKPTPTPLPVEERRARQAEARRALDQIVEEKREAVDQAERERLTAVADREEARLRSAEEAEAERRRQAEKRRLAEKQAREEAERRAAELEAERLAELERQRSLEERAGDEYLSTVALEDMTAQENLDDLWHDDDEDTPEIEVETTLDELVADDEWIVDGDARPIFDALYEQSRDGSTDFDASPGVRARIGTTFGVTDRMSIGTRLAATGFLGNFNPNFIAPGGLQDSSELETGTVTFDQLYLVRQWGPRFRLAVGRLQTRFQLRGVVYNKSLDRNNSHNWRVNWTDGVQATYSARNGWRSSFVMQYNPSSGPTGVRRDPLDFDDDGARFSYFLGFGNLEREGVVVQRAFDINYMPASLLKDGEPDGRRVDYWGFVGRLMFVWPPEKEGLRLRAGTEIGWAPETPTYDAMNLPGSGDVGGFAWNIVVSAMDFAPGHDLGLNYARTGAGWLIAPQYRPNHELLELRHLWKHKNWPLIETRIRRRSELIQQLGTVRARVQYDLFIRASLRFTVWER